MIVKVNKMDKNRHAPYLLSWRSYQTFYLCAHVHQQAGRVVLVFSCCWKVGISVKLSQIKFYLQSPTSQHQPKRTLWSLDYKQDLWLVNFTVNSLTQSWFMSHRGTSPWYGYLGAPQPVFGKRNLKALVEVDFYSFPKQFWLAIIDLMLS